MANSYQITLTAKDLDNSTALTAGVVECFNVGTQERVKTIQGGYTFTPNALGQVTIDLGNATTDWANGNIIIVSLYTESGTAKSVDYVFTVDTVTYPDGFDIENLAVMIGNKLFNGNSTNNTYNITAYSISNTDSSTRYIDFYNRVKGTHLMRVYIPTAATVNAQFNDTDLPFGGGIAKVPSVMGKIYPSIGIL